MIYLRIKVYPQGTYLSELLDFLETDLNVNFDWTPDKKLIRIITENEDNIKGFEAFILFKFTDDIEWEYHNEETETRYIAQRANKHTNLINKVYLIPFKENIDFMKNQ